MATGGRHAHAVAGRRQRTIAAGSDISISGPVNVSSITVAGDATIGTIGDGTISFPSWSGTIDVQAGTATFHAAIAGSFAETGPGTLLLDGTLDSATVTVAGGTCDILSPLAAAPVLAGGRAIGPGALFAADNQSLEQSIRPCSASYRASSSTRPSIART